MSDAMVQEQRCFDGAVQRVVAERLRKRGLNCKISLGFNYVSPAAREDLRARGYSQSGRKLQ